MFCIAVSPTYPYPVKGQLQGGAPFEFRAVFRRFSVDELQALSERLRPLAEGESGPPRLTDAQLLVHALAGWEGVTDEAGAPLEFTPSNLSRLLAIDGVRPAFVRAFYDSIAEARGKN